MDFVTAVKSVLGNYVTFSGRACRSEFWYFALFYFIVSIVSQILDAAIGMQPVSGIPSPVTTIVAVVFILPNIAVTVRRLHDTSRSGWWILLFLIPLVGAIILLIWYCQRGTRGDNRFGPDSLGGEPVAAMA